MLCTTSDTFRILAYSELYSFRYIQAYSRISALLKRIRAYSTPFLTLAYSQPYHIPSLGIFRTGTIFKSLWDFDQAYSEPCHCQNDHNSLFRHYSITPYSGIFRTLCIAYICKNLAYLESWNIQNPSLILSWCIFRNCHIYKNR